MAKNTTEQERESVTRLDILKKCKNSGNDLGLISSILITSLFIGSFFYLDYTALSKGIHYRGVSWLGLNDGSPCKEAAADGRPEFLEEGGDGCDLFDGYWLWDELYPLYQSIDCPFVDDGFRCLENGRPDSFYTKWRWQPKDCNLPRFNATEMLERLRNRRVVFAGDSIGRNQWESFLCMLASGIKNNSSIYEINGNPITKHQGFLVFLFEEYNCTLEYYRAPFLVYQGSPPAGAPVEVRKTLRLDALDGSYRRWKGADLVVFNSGHWWTPEKITRQGCYFQDGAEVKMNMSLEAAYQRSMETLVDFIISEIDMTKTLVLFRTNAPVHFTGGTWKTGGTCHLLKLPDLGSPANQTNNRQAEIITTAISRRSNMSKPMNLLDITSMTLQRKDGHTSIYNTGPGKGPGPLNRQDCSHWCLPGVPDSWNELVYAVFLKWESLRESEASVL